MSVAFKIDRYTQPTDNTWQIFRSGIKFVRVAIAARRFHRDAVLWGRRIFTEASMQMFWRRERGELRGLTILSSSWACFWRMTVGEFRPRADGAGEQCALLRVVRRRSSPHFVSTTVIETTRAWLSEQPQISTVARDRGGTSWKTTVGHSWARFANQCPDKNSNWGHRSLPRPTDKPPSGSNIRDTSSVKTQTPPFLTSPNLASRSRKPSGELGIVAVSLDGYYLVNDPMHYARELA